MSQYARLRSIERHVAASAPAGEESRDLTLLTDEQMQQFIGQGFLVLQPEELGAAFHRAVFENAVAEYGPDAEQRGSGSHGTTIERVPGLETLIESSTVAGALCSLLGPEYAHGHLGPSGCAFHASGAPGGPGQPFHKDTQRAQICGHRTRAAMVMYYPGGCTADMGPTAIVPSSHILARDGLGLSYGVMDDGPAGAEDRSDWGGLGGRAEILPKIAPGLFEHQIVVEAGSVVIVHEDMVHRGTPRLDKDAFRPMFKWSFMRLHEPIVPTWRHDPSTTSPIAADWPALVSPQAGPICESLWRWHLGDGSQVQMRGSSANANVVPNTRLETSVLAPPHDGDEAERMGAAYTLGECGNDSSLAILATALCSDDNESARRAGSFGLGVAGDRAVSTLIAVLDTGDEASGLVLGSAVEALGEAAVTPDPAVVSALDRICWVQKQIIAAAEGDEVPVFSQDNIHTNGDLRVPVMLPVTCRPIAARHLVISLAQTALGRIAQRWATTASAATGTAATGVAASLAFAEHRAAILDALRPWSAMPVPRIRKDNGRALFQLCVALASSAATPPSPADIAEADELSRVISGIEVVGKNAYLPLALQCLAPLRSHAAGAATQLG